MYPRSNREKHDAMARRIKIPDREELALATAIVPRTKFTEPVALSSTQPDDIPLPRSAVRLRFDLLALRARCVDEPMGRRVPSQGAAWADSRTLQGVLGAPTWQVDEEQ
jgi:hypothetical protein